MGLRKFLSFTERVFIMNILANTYATYLGLQILAMIVVTVTIFFLIMSRPSRAQLGSVLFGISALIYLFGFFIEITTTSLDIVCLAIKIEYFGECCIALSFTWFISEFCHLLFPKIIYVLELIVSILALSVIFTMEQHTYFYKGISLNTAGPFSRVQLSYGIGFYLLMAYLGLICITAFFILLARLRESIGVERKRIRLLMYAVFCPWIPTLIRALGLTGGYEISFLGVLSSTLFVFTALIHYGYFDSVQLAEENILYHSHEGIVITDAKKRILYFNKIILQVFPEIKKYTPVTSYSAFRDISLTDSTVFLHQNHYYEIRFESLIESGYVQGYMLRMLDMTGHYKRLHDAELSAHKDALTGLSDRSQFRHTLLDHLELGGSGAMLMLDLDNFKQINDTYGHGTGDDVLLALSDSIKEVASTPHLSCRIGGDEFCIFYKDITESTSLQEQCKQLTDTFREFLSRINLQGKTTLSIGIAITDDSLSKCENDIFDELYRRADRALYVSKNHGKNTYHFYQ